MEAVKLYFELIIIPLKKEIRKIQIRTNKKISLTRENDNEYLKKLEKLLLKHYKKMESLLENEFEY